MGRNIGILRSFGHHLIPALVPFTLQRNIMLLLSLDSKSQQVEITEEIDHSDDDEEIVEISREETSETILHLPIDVLYLISDHLDTPSAYSLALTCRGLWHSGLPQTRHKLLGDEKRDLLLTLEKDQLASDCYYCHRCNKLHTFDTAWGPHSPIEESPISEGLQCRLRDRFAPTGNAYELSYHHARLVMNAHLHGPTHGISLQNICLSQQLHREFATIGCKTSAAIIKDELFLNRTYRFAIQNKETAAFRKCTGARDFRICEHLPFFRNSSIYRQNIPELQRKPRGGSTWEGDEFVPCKSVPGSCGICLMDYDVTIERVNHGAAWNITINAYHQLGHCRSPDDWKWARFTEKTRPHLFLPNRPNRRGGGYFPGTVKRTWQQGNRQGIFAGNNIHSKRHSI